MSWWPEPELDNSWGLEAQETTNASNKRENRRKNITTPVESFQSRLFNFRPENKISYWRLRKIHFRGQATPWDTSIVPENIISHK